jgi:hypothetical protein
MPVEQGSGTTAPDRQLTEIVDRLAATYEARVGLHRDVIEAAVRSGWAKYGEAKVTTYRAILAERAAADTLRRWFDSEPALNASGVDRPALYT